MMMGHLEGGGEVAVLVDRESRPIVEIVDQCVPVCFSNLKKNTKYARKRKGAFATLAKFAKNKNKKIGFHLCKNV